MGGFAPPTPTAIHTISASRQVPQVFLVQAVTNPSDMAALSAPPKELNVKDDHTKLVAELHGILKTLPTEHPAGSEDIYGLDTSIAWFSDDLMWINGGPQGCGGGKSEGPAPSEEQKQKFKRAVEIVTHLSNCSN